MNSHTTLQEQQQLCSGYSVCLIASGCAVHWLEGVFMYVALGDLAKFAGLGYTGGHMQRPGGRILAR